MISQQIAKFGPNPKIDSKLQRKASKVALQTGTRWVEFLMVNCYLNIKKYMYDMADDEISLPYSDEQIIVEIHETLRDEYVTLVSNLRRSPHVSFYHWKKLEFELMLEAISRLLLSFLKLRSEFPHCRENYFIGMNILLIPIKY